MLKKTDNPDREYQRWYEAGRRQTNEELSARLGFWFCLAWAFGMSTAVATYALVTRH